MLIAFAIVGAFAILITTISFGFEGLGEVQLSNASNAITHAVSSINYSITPLNEFRVQD